MTESRFFRQGGFRAGDWVEVKSAEEILATLDGRSCVDGLPFMPEMLQYCGMRFRVFKSAHKTCDTIRGTKIRHMADAAHLEGVRCDGSSHGGCQAGCLLFWKSAWLRRVNDKHWEQEGTESNCKLPAPVDNRLAGCDLARLTRATRVSDIHGEQAGERYCCQATELFRATTLLRWWDPRPYVGDLVSRNVCVRDFVHYAAIAALNILMRLPHRLIKSLLNNKFAMQVRRVVGNRAHSERNNQPTVYSRTLSGGDLMVPRESSRSVQTVKGPRRRVLRLVNRILAKVLRCLLSCPPAYPTVRGVAGAKTPKELLDLKPGELVQVRSKNEIEQTINDSGKNRGLSFVREMVPYCGKTFRVLRRVERIINEKTGALNRLPNDCIILDGVICDGCLSQSRLFCPRSIYPYWREIWLRRVEQIGQK